MLSMLNCAKSLRVVSSNMLLRFEISISDIGQPRRWFRLQVATALFQLRVFTAPAVQYHEARSTQGSHLREEHVAAHGGSLAALQTPEKTRAWTKGDI
jgi:hypothetical protein